MEIVSTLIQANPLYFSFLFPMLTDGIATLLGQDRSYWKNYKSAKEASPAYFFMAVHPVLYIVGAIIWFIGLYWIFMILPHTFNLIVACGFIAGNSWGSASWIAQILRKKGLYSPENRISILIFWTILVLYFLLIGIFATVFLSLYFQQIYLLSFNNLHISYR